MPQPSGTDQTGRDRRGRSVRVDRALVWLGWFAALNLLWLLLISSFVLEETILGLFASALAATAAVAVREQVLVAFRPQPRWLLAAWRLPGRTARESLLVLGALARHLAGRGLVRGSFRTRRVALPDDPAESAAKRALLIAGESFAPNAYVLGVDEDSGLMLTHELVGESDR
jgi:hypothetical protein